MNDPRFQQDGISGHFPSRAGQSEALADPAESVALPQSGELKTLLDGFLETIIKSVGAGAGAIRVLSSDGQEWQLAGAVGLPSDFFACESNVERGCGVCGEAARAGEILQVEAALCAGRAGGSFFGEACQRVVAVPLEFRGNLIGVFNLFFGPGQEMAEDAARVLRSFAEMIGIALENARLTRENQRMNLMAERLAISNEIHDSLAQNLVYSRMRLSVLQEALRKQDEQLAQKCVKDVKEAVEAGQKSVRELITHFRCQMDPLGLQHALQELAANFFERTGITLDYVNRVADLSLPIEHELQVFHIVREVLCNVATHSGASHASLSVLRQDDRCQFVVEDNGAGMSASLPPDGHYGLTIMRERAQRIGAEIEFESSAGNGTRVRLVLAK